MPPKNETEPVVRFDTYCLRLVSSLTGGIHWIVGLTSDDQLCPHILMPHAAELMTRNPVFPGAFKLGLNCSDITRHDHRVKVCPFYQKTVDDIRADCPKHNRSVHRNFNDRGRK